MISKIPVCARIGFVAGFFTGTLTSCYGQRPFFSNSGIALPINTVSGLPSYLLGGLVVAFIFSLITSTLHILLFRYSSYPITLMAIIVAIPVGLISGWLTSGIVTMWIAAVASAIVGFSLGWLICWLLCGRKRLSVYKEVSHGKR